jgi:hypothetical protein
MAGYRQTEVGIKHRLEQRRGLGKALRMQIPLDTVTKTMQYL